MPEILSFQEPGERLAARRKNTRLLVAHWALAILLFIVFVVVFIREPNSNALAVAIVGFLMAHMLAATVLALPSRWWSGIEYPEIILLDDRLVYVGGSRALWYPRFWHMFIRHLLGTERSTVVKKKHVLSTGIDRPLFLGPGAGFFKCFRIRHKDGDIRLCICEQEGLLHDVREKVERWLSANCS